tara:strand:+ start:616 stop:816 length:201 start_codon:yes stop_codon:yes gene_type:complete
MSINMLIEHSITCPYCSEQFSILVDGSEPDAEYVEDCQVCCQPMTVIVELDDDNVLQRMEVRRENE